MNEKIGFWAVFGIVIGSQIGTGAFLLPATLAPFGLYSILGLCITGFGAICLAFVFAHLSSIYSKNGGPHIYVKQVFGLDVAFFVGWTYWVISWASTSVVVIASISFLSPLIGPYSPEFYIGLQILLLILITYINIVSINIAGTLEFILTLLKVIPLIAVPILCSFYFDYSNINVDPDYKLESTSSILGNVISLTLWGFIGLESATCSTGTVKNPSVTIPLAIIIGTTTVALLYLFNSIAIMGVVHSSELSQSSMPYVNAVEKVLKGDWHILVSVISSIACIGSLNAWMLTSGQISLSLSEEGLFPKFFGKINNSNSPYIGLIISAILIMPLLLITADANILDQLKKIIDFSVTAFLYVYLICSISYFVIHIKTEKIGVWKIFSTLIAILFCLFVIFQTDYLTHLVALSFVAAGIPLYIIYKITTQ